MVRIWEIRVYADRIELCGITVVTNSKSNQMSAILTVLTQQLDEHRYKAFPGGALANLVDCAGGQGGIAGSVRDFRRHATEILGMELGLIVDHDDVIETASAGYRLNARIVVKDLRNTGSRPSTDARANAGRDPVNDGPDDPANGRRNQIMAMIRSGERLRVPGFAEKLRCSYTTAKREVDALKSDGQIEFVGPAKLGYYREIAASS